MLRSVLGTLALALTLRPATLVGCSCVCNDPVSLQQEVASASAIVLAEVVETFPRNLVDSRGNEELSSCGEETVHLRVAQVLKGAVAKDLFSRHGAIGTPCDFRFTLVPGKRYLLFLGGSCLDLNACSRSLPVERAGQLIREVQSLLNPSADRE